MAIKQNKVIVILGPTATGKSDLGVLLAREFNGEIISADSRQVYRGMNIGTGKITKKEMREVKHHLLDVVSPNSSYNAAKYEKSAKKKILEISKKNKIPFIVGGTGFWIDAALGKIELPDVPPNQKLRKKLSTKSAEKLFKELQKLNPNRAKNIDSKNKVRLIRAIEIEKYHKKIGKSINKITPKNPAQQEQKQILYIGLDLPTEKLYSKIDSRLESRLRKGMLKEVQNLHANKVSWKKLEDFGLEYRYLARYLKNEITKEQMQTELSFAIKHYAKRQRTWFKRNKEIIWLDPSKKTTPKKAAALVKKFLQK